VLLHNYRAHPGMPVASPSPTPITPTPLPPNAIRAAFLPVFRGTRQPQASPAARSSLRALTYLRTRQTRNSAPELPPPTPHRPAAGSNHHNHPPPTPQIWRPWSRCRHPRPRSAVRRLPARTFRSHSRSAPVKQNGTDRQTDKRRTGALRD
jgi:hypothetical protein